MHSHQFSEFVRNTAGESFRRDGHLAAVVVFLQPQGISAELLPMDDKDKAARLLQRVRASSPLVAVVTEAWYVDLTTLTPEQQEQALAMPPSEHPKRIEVAMVTVYQGSRKTGHTADIIRKGREKPVLGPWREAPMAEAEGRFVTPPAEWN